MACSSRSAAPSGEKVHEWVIMSITKRLGILYIVYALLFLVIGGIEATIMRISSSVRTNDFVSPRCSTNVHNAWHHYDFLSRAMPMLFGFATI